MIRILTALALSAAIVACGTGTSAVTSPTPHPGDSLPNRHQIDWDNPWGDLAREADVVAVVQSPAAFGVKFRPARPAFPGAFLRKAKVNAAGDLAFLYDFAGDARFKSDARVSVFESTYPELDDTLVHQMMAHPAANLEYSLHDVDGTSVLLMQYQDLGRALFVHNRVVYDITGPAVPPDVVLDLASQLRKQLA